MPENGTDAGDTHSPVCTDVHALQNDSRVVYDQDDAAGRADPVDQSPERSALTGGQKNAFGKARALFQWLSIDLPNTGAAQVARVAPVVPTERQAPLHVITWQTKEPHWPGSDPAFRLQVSALVRRISGPHKACSLAQAITQLFRLTAVFGGHSSAPTQSSAFVLPGNTSTDQAIVLLVEEVNRLHLLIAQGQDNPSAAVPAKPLGAVFLAASGLLLIMGTLRYFRVQAALQRGLFMPAKKSIVLSSSVVFALIVAAFAVVLAFR